MTPELREAALKAIDEGVRDQPYGIRSWSELHRLIENLGFTCSRQTLTTHMKSYGIVLRTVRKSPALTSVHKEKRVRFCEEMLTWSDAELSNIIWMDEKKFTCGKSGGHITYLCRKTDAPKEQQGELDAWHGGNGVMVWMAASLKHGFHLHVFPSVRSQGNRGTVTGAIFDEAMKKRGGLISYLKRHRSSVIAMDNCTVHNLARTSFQETGITVLPWPAKSPDLMPVENLWSIMDNFKNGLAPRNRTDLIIAIEAAFQDIQTTHSIAFENAMKSFRKRCRIVIEKNGGNCNYY